MTEPIKKTNTSAWMTALKEYNLGKQWCVPKKDTPEYKAVKEIADRIKVEKQPKGVNLSVSIPSNPNGSTDMQFVDAPVPPSKKTRKRKSKEPVE